MSRQQVTLRALLLYELEQWEKEQEEEMQRQPTRGQQRILQLCCRVAYVLSANHGLNGNQAHRLVVYRIWESATGRLIQEVTPQMVASLTRAGWIERAGGDTREWWYRVTEAGIAAANLPTSDQEK